jgi:ketosteroid isomerase-like protein
MPAKEPEEWDALFEKYVNEGDLDSLVALYEPDATLVNPGQLARGTDAIRAALKPLIDAGMKVKLNVTQTIVAGDIAVTYNEWPGSRPCQAAKS